MLLKMLQEARSQTLSSFLLIYFCRVTPVIADEICKAARVLPEAKPLELCGVIAETYDHTISSDENYGSVILNGANSSVTSG